MNDNTQSKVEPAIDKDEALRALNVIFEAREREADPAPMDDIRRCIARLRFSRVSYRRMRAMFDLAIIEREDEHERRAGL